MAFENPHDGSLDYFLCRYGKSRLTFRGPHRKLTGRYVAMVGGLETYGKFVATPFPELVERKIGLPVVNLGLANAGADAFLNDPDVMQVIEKADITVFQILGAQNLSNRFYSVHPRRNDRFVGASPQLRSIFRDVDFTEVHFTKHLLHRLRSRSVDRFEVVAEELRAAWVRQMRSLLRAAKGKTVLMWVGVAPPPPPGRRGDLAHEPLLVDSEMIAALRSFAPTYLEVVPATNAWAGSGTDDLVLGPLDAAMAQGMPGPAVHQAIAEALVPQLMSLK